jgi:hypothetical protein
MDEISMLAVSCTSFAAKPKVYAITLQLNFHPVYS